QSERQKLVQHTQDVQRFRDERQKLEINAAGGPAAPTEAHTKQFEPARAKFSSSPIVGRSFDQLGKGVAQPKIYNAPKPDLTIEPKPRVNPSAGQPQQHTVNRLPLDAKQLQPNVQVQQRIQPSAPPAHVNQPAPQTRGNAPSGPPQGGQNLDKAKDKVKDK
ncbi:MAG: hypothetical protein ABSE63_17575, partial [Thermoguttaceae bacterium]